MKRKTYHILLAGLASIMIASAQTNNTPAGQPADNPAQAAARAALATPSGDTNAPATVADTNAPAAVDTNATAAAAAPATTNAVPDTGTATATNVVTATNTVAAAADTNAAPLTATSTNADLSATSSTNGPAAPSIPLIQFADVPLTTAIEHLARQAGINYMMDPKIGYGQPDQSGQIKPEPQLSIRWENITAENALKALLDNYSLQLVVDKKTGIDRVTIKDPTAPPPLITRVIQLQYASTTNMMQAVQSVLGDKRSRVIGDARTSQLLVVATEPEQASVDTLITQLDKPTRQVLIETKLIEISSSPTATRGVDWSGTLAAQHVSFGNLPGGGIQLDTLAGFNPSTATLTADGVHAVISFLNASYDAQTFSTPRVVTLDNEPAHIEVVRTFPIISLSGASANSASSASVTYSNVGTILDVTPRISANDNIWLNVIPEVSSHFADETVIVPSAGGAAGSFSVPIFDRRRIQSQVMVPNGNTLVMGGLVQDNPNQTFNKVPFLGDIPGLGWAFHSETKNMTKDNLIIFMTPTIVKDADFQPAPTTYLQSQPTTMQQPMNPHKIWDGAEPERDWSNPAPVPGEFTGPKPTY